MKLRNIIASASVVGALAAGGGIFVATQSGGASNGQRPPMPPAPPWVNRDGSINVNRLPGGMQTPPPYQGPHRPAGVIDGTTN